MIEMTIAGHAFSFAALAAMLCCSCGKGYEPPTVDGARILDETRREWARQDSVESVLAVMPAVDSVMAGSIPLVRGDSTADTVCDSMSVHGEENRESRLREMAGRNEYMRGYNESLRRVNGELRREDSLRKRLRREPAVGSGATRRPDFTNDDSINGKGAI